MLYIVGLGPGHKDYILPIANKTMEKSDLVIGFERAVNSIEHIKVDKKIVNTLKDTLQFINENKEKTISIIASGDPCFYGITEYIKKNYLGELQVIPGISSFQYFMSKLNKSWQKIHLGSMHGREEQFLQDLLKYKEMVILTDSKNSPKNLCNILFENNIQCEIAVGENLSYEDEKITIEKSDVIKDLDFGKLSVMYLKLLDKK